ncbi:beta-lactamase family protein [Arthrobacter sp. BL-252-APC-1A]|uniref:serine hydrolase domain-containing protein n=1 Tax=Arthrobacter sp. BL-252-APC-1A TaxID=2606622 RepID=UPI0012B2E296|nr:serine hydrolase domain-containing protein [Arthrobacter sp. BL-252-APC-1A]MSR98493.1 beta-lactamase family protein [Arthrobacter sp. BL-252-APC-1A]
MDLTGKLQDLLGAAVGQGMVPSAVCAVALDGEALPVLSAGQALRFGAGGALLPAAEQVPAEPGTWYDLASVTKPFSAVAVLALVRDGLLDLDEPVAARLPAFAAAGAADPGKQLVTLRHLLTHTSGLPGIWDGWRQPLPDRRAALASLLSVPLAAEPGTGFSYSCVGYNTAMALAETATGTAWEALIQQLVLDPLEQDGDITFRPDPGHCAATECGTPDGRALVRGEVHDESAHALGGAAANAGLFGTASGALRFAEALRGGFPEILPGPLADLLWQDQLDLMLGPAAAEARTGVGYGQSLGLRIGQLGWMGADAADARGHNGFTGTCFLTDRQRRLSVVLLTNRVHPTRDGTGVVPLQKAVSEAVYAAA